MKRTLLSLALAGVAAPGWAQSSPAPSPTPRPERTAIEAQCSRDVEQRHPHGTLSRNRSERERLVQVCVANGGRLP